MGMGDYWEHLVRASGTRMSLFFIVGLPQGGLPLIHIDFDHFSESISNLVCGTSEQTLNFVAGLLYYICIIAGGNRGPGGPMANDDAYRVP